MGIVARWNQLSFNQQITAALSGIAAVGAVGSLIVGISALAVTLTSKETASAIDQLKTIAAQGTRQTRALQRQNTLTHRQVRRLSDQNKSLAQQAEAAKSFVETASAELLVSRSQLNNSLEILKIYGAEERRNTIVAAAQYRTIRMEVENLPIPSELGKQYGVRVLIYNTGPYPITLEHRNWGVAIVPEAPEVLVDQAIRQGFETAGKAPARLITIGPWDTHQQNVKLSEPISPEMISAITDRRFNIVAFAAVRYRDPLGKVHHEYICRFSRWDRLNNLCGTPRPD